MLRVSRNFPTFSRVTHVPLAGACSGRLPDHQGRRRGTPETLRNWDRADKLKPIRHPVNGYRLYSIAELRALLRMVFQTKRERHRSDKAAA